MYNTNKYDTVMFDMDGTVLKSEDLFTEAEILLLADYGVNVKATELSEFKGVSPDFFYSKFKKKFDIKESDNILKDRLLVHLYSLFNNKLSYVDGFKSFYKNYIYKNQIKTALVTNTSRNIVDKINELIEIDIYFKTITTSSDVSHGKPHPEPYIATMAALGSTPPKTLIIEDSKVGILSGLKSGADVISLLTTLTKKEIRAIDPEILCFSGYMDIYNYLQ